MNTTLDPDWSPARFGFAHRVAAVFGLLALVLIWLGVTVSLGIRGMQHSISRVIEEQREASYARDLLHALSMLETHLQVRVGLSLEEEERATLLEYISNAEHTLGEMRSGPAGEDPSMMDHTVEEEKLYDSLERGLHELVVSIDGANADLRERVAVVRRHATVLNDEVREEALESTNALRDEGFDLRDAVLWTTSTALVVLALVLWMVWHFVVQPVERLRNGAARIAGGDLAHRVAVASGDEIGELAQEFNRMAIELAGMRSELEARVEQRTQEFLRAARLAGLGTMAAGIAHEINNPLASIASCAEGLERKLTRGTATPEQEREYLQIIANEAYRAHEITSRLLEFARSEQGPKTDFVVADVLHDLDVLISHRLRDRNLRLESSCDAELPPLHGNPSEYKQVVLNLVDNAIDVSPDGGVIRIACKRASDEVILEVEDQGPGVPADVIGRIFDPFFTTKAPGKGTGLGLAIVHRIVESHGGKVEVANTGHGALFRVRMKIENV